MDVNLSKKAKIMIGVALFLAAAPLYLASNSGMEKIVKNLWEKSDDPKSPEQLYYAMRFYNATWREDKFEALAKEWLKHYGGDETEKEKSVRYDTWDQGAANTFPFGEDLPRPPQKGEDYRPTPHPLTAKVLLIWASRLEDGHQLQQAVHIYELLNNEKYCEQWAITRDAENKKDALGGVQRNSSGNRSF